MGHGASHVWLLPSSPPHLPLRVQELANALTTASSYAGATSAAAPVALGAALQVAPEGSSAVSPVSLSDALQAAFGERALGAPLCMGDGVPAQLPHLNRCCARLICRPPPPAPSAARAAAPEFRPAGCRGR